MIIRIENLDDYSTHGFRAKYIKFINGLSKEMQIEVSTALCDFINHLGDEEYTKRVYSSHKLNKKYECHLLYDVILIYTYTNGTFDFIDIGSHKELLRNRTQKKI